MGSTINTFREECVRQLEDLPCESCPLALERINAIKSENVDKKKVVTQEPEVGCPWFVTSAEHHYCFWVYDKGLYGNPASDKEICDLLLMNKPTLESVFQSAIAKERLIKDSEDIVGLKDAVAEMSENSGVDYTTYMPSEFRDVIHKSATDGIGDAEEVKEKPKPKIKHPTGLPLHRDGKKVDLFGLYSRKPAPKRGNIKDGKVKKPKKTKKNNKK